MCSHSRTKNSSACRNGTTHKRDWGWSLYFFFSIRTWQHTSERKTEKKCNLMRHLAIYLFRRMRRLRWKKHMQIVPESQHFVGGCQNGKSKNDASVCLGTERQHIQHTRAQCSYCDWNMKYSFEFIGKRRWNEAHCSVSLWKRRAEIAWRKEKKSGKQQASHMMDRRRKKNEKSQLIISFTAAIDDDDDNSSSSSQKIFFCFCMPFCLPYTYLFPMCRRTRRRCVVAPQSTDEEVLLRPQRMQKREKADLIRRRRRRERRHILCSDTTRLHVYHNHIDAETIHNSTSRPSWVIFYPNRNCDISSMKICCIEKQLINVSVADKRDEKHWN